MSEYKIPFHIQEEIVKRLPVKSLVQFRSVSKVWKSLIDGFEFIKAHSIRHHTQPQHMLVWYGDPVETVKYVCFVDDDTFPQQSYIPTLPPSVKQLNLPTVIGSSHGLVCFYGLDPEFTTKMAVIWNPWIRKSIAVPVVGEPSVGFGVCPVTCDPKIVAITQSQDFNHCEVMVYTLSSGKWNPSNNLPTKPIRDAWSPVVTNRFIYWIAGLNLNMIMSFDVTNEKFEVMDLPDTVDTSVAMSVSISKIRESLAMLENKINSCVVWIMEDGVQRSFTKLFTIQAPVDSVVGFRKNGIPIMLVPDGDYDGPFRFVAYEPNSEHDNVLELGSSLWFNIISYIETPLLFHRSDCSSF
ncbi:hypothetical protein L1887_37001 [Cichorium endivia]|nr:hypothetical protein L1887_37001 [Cichorium endivia]